MTFNVQSELRKFRVWQILTMEDFRCSYAYVAEVLDMNVDSVRYICKKHGWVAHWEDDVGERDSRAASQSIAVDKLMLDHAHYSRITCYSSESDI